MAGITSLAAKLAYVMSQIRYIQKRGRNKFHGYNYATEADVNDRVREVLAEQRIIMVPNLKSTEMRETKTKNGDTEYIARVNMNFTFIDGDSGEQITLSMSGEGQDRGDKAIYKAISGTQKYALMKLFMIPTGDDPEADPSSDEPQNRTSTNSEGQSNNNSSKPQPPNKETKQPNNVGNNKPPLNDAQKKQRAEMVKLGELAEKNGYDKHIVRELISKHTKDEWPGMEVLKTVAAELEKMCKTNQEVGATA
jgi:hypothetical protein